MIMSQVKVKKKSCIFGLGIECIEGTYLPTNTNGIEIALSEGNQMRTRNLSFPVSLLSFFPLVFPIANGKPRVLRRHEEGRGAQI